eukprot:CAMPEP_0115867102 /NCGR_PEP_ID=MMETSP0287-20121206/20594_1 /TAXON_ID=412157 /ORGANISM="Chrysochromulina rotalis, Strain UIO044" /LENGTH=353 /DNA_ID=CAMNT_0003321695 /DNA_START=175 /DNA_END=1234 /DNA_ORIENTATION=-
MGGGARQCADLLRERGVHVLRPPVGPVSSCHDRACEIFYALKGGAIDFGEEHSKAHGHSRWAAGCDHAMLPDWDETRPIILLCHSQGAMSALYLLQQLADGAFAGFATSARWVRGVVCIASPLSGVPLLESVGGVPPPRSLRQGRATFASVSNPLESMCMKTSSVEQFVGKGLVGLVILLGYIMEVLIGWSAAFRRNVWDWRLEQWQLQRRDLPELLCGRHALLHSSDTALYELMPAGAQHHSLHFRMHDGVFFVSLPCQITDLDGRHALASAQCSPHMVATAAIIDFLGEDETRHSDGLILPHFNDTHLISPTFTYRKSHALSPTRLLPLALGRRSGAMQTRAASSTGEPYW